MEQKPGRQGGHAPVSNGRSRLDNRHSLTGEIDPERAARG
jgi:hypothetical protein